MPISAVVFSKSGFHFRAGGKRGGARTLVASKSNDQWFFIYGYAKNDLEDLSQFEIRLFKEFAKDMFRLTPDELDAYLANGTIVEIGHETKSQER